MDDLVEKLVSGELKWHQIDKLLDGDSAKATEIRRKAVEKITGLELKHIAHHNIDMKRAMKVNIENSIGVVQIPMGIAGPLKVKGDYADGDYMIPLATTEGALVASVSRGISMMNKAGGASSVIIKKGTTRGPVLKAPDARKAREVADWVNSNKPEIKKVVEATDPFIKFVDVVPYQVANNLFLRFIYDTGDAMGMNMVTVATDKTLAVIEEKFPFLVHIALSGNMCIDKKPSALTLIEGRGTSVISEIVIPKELVSSALKSTPEAVADVCYRKNLLGSAKAGSYGFNAHFANIVGALFLACGQDEAHIVEGSHGFTTAEVTKEGDLYVSVTLPALMVGTIGGGTGVDTQTEALKIIGVSGGAKEAGKNSKTFAEIVAATVLAGEISLMGALAARHLTQAHVRLNR